MSGGSSSGFLNGGASGGDAGSGGVQSGSPREGGAGSPAAVVPNGGAGLYGRLRSGEGITKAEADVWYVNVEGDTMTGPLAIPAGTVGGLPLGLDPAPGNTLTWDAGGLFVPAVAGEPGPQGPPGPAGADGTDGTDGATGAQGAPGPAGPQGVQGDQGPQGVQGVQGPAGATGADGAAGPAGAAGVGVPTGGATGEVLTKTSATDYATAWQAPTGGGGSAEVTISGTEGVTVVESPANTFVLGLTASPDASNTVEVRANGIYAAAGAIPPEYVTEAELATALGPYATDADLAGALAGYSPTGHAHAAAYVDVGGDAMTGPLTISGKGVAVSATAGNDLAWNADGFYVDAPTKGHGHTAPADGGTIAYLPLAGGTMSGSLTAPTVVGVTTGAATTPRLFSTGFAPTTNGANGNDYGVRFRCTVTGVLEAIRWYRRTSGDVVPATVKLWDTVTASAVLTMPAGDQAPWADLVLGWKFATLTTPVTLVAGRDYILALSYVASGNVARLASYTPVPEAPLVWVANILATTGGMPVATGTHGNGLDVSVRVFPPVAPVAQSGTLRLPNGAAAAVAWRNAADSADLTLTADASDRLAYSGTTLQLGGDTAATLSRTGAGALRADTHLGVGVNPRAWAATIRALDLGAAGSLQVDNSVPSLNLQNNVGPGGTAIAATTASIYQQYNGGHVWLSAPGVAAGAAQTFTTRMALDLAGNLGVGVNPVTGWAANWRALQIGERGVLTSPAAPTGLLRVGENTYTDGAADRAIVAGGASFIDQSGGALAFRNAPSVAAGAAQTFTTRAAIAPTGTLTLTPDAGQDALAFGSGRLSGTATEATLFTAGSARAQLHSASGAVTPAADNVNGLGSGVLRWTTVYAVAGAINTSSREAKEGITPLDPARAMEAVRNTEAVTFDYKAPAKPDGWYDLPDDPEQAEAVLAQRLTAAPLEAAARHQAGFIAEAADQLFLVGEGQTSPGNSVGVLLACLQNIDQRLSALEGA